MEFFLRSYTLGKVLRRRRHPWLIIKNFAFTSLFIYDDTRSRISRVRFIFATGAICHKAKPTVGCFTPLGQAYSPQKATQASQS